MTTPILYSFRRCPYAIRTRMSLAYSQIRYELREVVLRDKPQAMLEKSPKGTVPVLVLPNDKVIDESRDIMLWALEHHDPDDWYSAQLASEITQLIDINDQKFKANLDRYKYFERYPEFSQQEYRASGGEFLSKLEDLLNKNHYLFRDTLCLADVAIFPFIRQFAHVDFDWFLQSSYQALVNWEQRMENHELFKQVMKKYKPWQEGEQPCLVG